MAQDIYNNAGVLIRKEDGKIEISLYQNGNQALSIGDLAHLEKAIHSFFEERKKKEDAEHQDWLRRSEAAAGGHNTV